jgi:hypothetical protein
MVTAEEPDFQRACRDDDALLAFGPHFALAATLIQELLKNTQVNLSSIDAGARIFRCNLRLIDVSEALEYFAVGALVQHYGTILEDTLLPADQRVRIHARAVVLQDFTTAVFDCRVADRTPMLMPPCFSTQKDTLLDEDRPAAV